MAVFIEPGIKIDFYKLERFDSVEQSIEDAARTCYKSKDKITAESADKLVRSLLRRKHGAMLEFGYARATIIANRGVTHELVRHRLCSFAQESTRYVDYAAQEGGIEFIIPPELSKEIPRYSPNREIVVQCDLDIWKSSMCEAERSYQQLRGRGVPAQIARGVLPIDIKTEIVVSTNLREWQHIFELRCAPTAHPHIRRLFLRALKEFAQEIPSMFDEQRDRMFACDHALRLSTVRDGPTRCGECIPCRELERN